MNVPNLTIGPRDEGMKRMIGRRIRLKITEEMGIIGDCPTTGDERSNGCRDDSCELLGGRIDVSGET